MKKRMHFLIIITIKIIVCLKALSYGEQTQQTNPKNADQSLRDAQQQLSPVDIPIDQRVQVHAEL